MTVIFCENSPNSPAGSGYGDGVGEITLMLISRYKNTLVKIYQNWRGKSFKLAEKASWPAKVSEVQEMIKRFNTIRISGKSS